jgi:hypothetical protein
MATQQRAFQVFTCCNFRDIKFIILSDQTLNRLSRRAYRLTMEAASTSKFSVNFHRRNNPDWPPSEPQISRRLYLWTYRRGRSVLTRMDRLSAVCPPYPRRIPADSVLLHAVSALRIRGQHEATDWETGVRFPTGHYLPFAAAAGPIGGGGWRDRAVISV